MDILTIIILIIMGFFIGIISILLGIGGGLIYNPLLIYAFQIDARVASVISSFVIIFTSGSGFLKYRAAKRVDLKTSRAFLKLAIPGALVGALLGTIITPNLIKFTFAIFIGASAIRGILKALLDNSDNMYSDEVAEIRGLEKREIVDSDGDRLQYHVNLKISQPLAFVGGLVAGLLGVGGGIIFSPLLITLTGLPVQIAVATSSSIIALVSIVALITKVIGFSGTGLLDISLFINYGLPLAFGAVFGARFGAARVKRIKSSYLLIAFWSVALISAIRMGLGADIF